MKNSEEKQIEIPELEHLEELESSVKKSTVEAEQTITSLKDLPIEEFDLNKIEVNVTNFFIQKMNQSGLLSRINNVNDQVMKLMGEIKFFSSASSYVTGFFSSDFSSNDKEKWQKIEGLLDEIYNKDRGIISQIQDQFLFRISREQIYLLLGREISLEEELLVQSVLVKCYLVNLRQLIIPFYNIDDEIFIKFKNERIKYLKSKPFDDEPAKQERFLLENQVSSLRSRSADSIVLKQKSEETFNAAYEQLSRFGNTLANSTGSVNTARYIASFISHKTSNLSQVASTAAKSAGFFSKLTSWVPIVSGVVEMGNQMNNNRIVYNYEKKLKALEVVEVVKRDLLILEQQTVDHYLNNIIIRLQKTLFYNRQLVSKQVSLTSQRHKEISNKAREDVEVNVENVRQEYYKAAKHIIKQVHTIHQKDLDNKDDLILEKDEIIQKNKDEIGEKQVKIEELDETLRLLKNDIESQEKVLKKTIEAKAKETERLNNAIDSLKRSFDYHKGIAEEQQKSLRDQEIALNLAISGKLPEELRVLYVMEVERRQELQATVHVLMQQKIEHEEQVGNLEADLKCANAHLKREIECAEAINEMNNTALDKLKRERKEYQDKIKTLDKEHRELENEHREVGNKLSLLRVQEPIHKAAVEELQRSINIEITKCNRYRSEIKDLKAEIDKGSNLNDLYKRSLKEKELLRAQLESQRLRVEELQSQRDIPQKKENEKIVEDLKKQVFWTKAKLTGVLALDSCRNFLPESVGKWITNTETALLAGEVLTCGDKILWGSVIAFVIFGIISGIWRILSWLISWRKSTVKVMRNKTK